MGNLYKLVDLVVYIARLPHQPNPLGTNPNRYLESLEPGRKHTCDEKCHEEDDLPEKWDQRDPYKKGPP